MKYTMKKVKFSLYVILTLTCTSLAAEWTMTNSDSEQTDYFDFSTKRKSGHIVKIWALSDYKKEQYLVNSKYLSTKHLFELNCSDETFRIVFGLSYDKHMGLGNPIESYFDNEAEWIPIPPETRIEKELHILCKK